MEIALTVDYNHSEAIHIISITVIVVIFLGVPIWFLYRPLLNMFFLYH